MRRLFSVTRTGVLLIFVGHLLACVAVIALMPGGWRWTSIEFAGYRAVPLIVGVSLLMAIAAPRRFGLDRLMVALLLGAWLTMATVPLVMFPTSGPRLAAGAAAVTLSLVAAFASVARAIARRNVIALAASGVVGVVAALVALSLLRSPQSSTRPQSIAFEPVIAGAAERRMLRLDPTFALDPSQATVTVNAGRRYVYIEPVLTFTQRSPDANWTIFAAKRDRVPPTRVLAQTSMTDHRAEASYTDATHAGPIAESRLTVTRVDERAAKIESTTHLHQEVWTHLNSFTQLTIAGHRRLRVRFSAVPETTIEVRNAGYPFGAPARFAFIDRDSIFRVVEATSAEKGPFRELAAGRLDGPLTMTLLDGEEAFMAITLHDWATQASVEPSPTAGWNVPQHSIEFSLLSEDPKSPASFFISLASTGVGRGFNSVGHSPGVYRNRIDVTLPTR